ncbi:MAG: hypothetical protein HQL68_06805 [Magnetococcales bacterium]|nr:hypothetical protein [Magnetococcales bacterium]
MKIHQAFRIVRWANRLSRYLNKKQKKLKPEEIKKQEAQDVRDFLVATGRMRKVNKKGSGIRYEADLLQPPLSEA